MRTHAIHLVVDAFAFPIQLSFDSESGELIGDDTKGPARRVRRGSIVPEGKNLGRGSIFVAFAEGTESADGSSFLWGEIRGPAAPLGGNDHPSSMDRIFSQFGHRGFTFGRKCGLKRGNFF
jgi:hypothetical protein